MKKYQDLTQASEGELKTLDAAQLGTVMQKGRPLVRTPFFLPLISAVRKSFNIGKFQFNVSRAPVIALPGMRRGLHVAQQGVHFFNAQTPSGAHRRVAASVPESSSRCSFTASPCPAHQFPRPYLSKDPHIAFIHKGGHFAHHDGGWASCSGPKRSITKPSSASSPARDINRSAASASISTISGTSKIWRLIHFRRFAASCAHNERSCAACWSTITNPSWVCANMYVSCNCARQTQRQIGLGRGCLIVQSGSGRAQPIDGVFGKAAIIGWCDSKIALPGGSGLGPCCTRRQSLRVTPARRDTRPEG